MSCCLAIAKSSKSIPVFGSALYMECAWDATMIMRDSPYSVDVFLTRGCIGW